MRFDFDFLKDRYNYELQRREHLTAALTLPVGVLTVLGGAMVAMARSFSYQDGLLVWIFGILLCVDVVAFFLCLLDLGRAYHRQKYIYLPLLADLEQAQEEFRDFNSYVEATGGEVEETFDEHFRRRLIDAADRNTENNDYRSGQLHWARIALFAVLALTALMGIPYVVDQVRY